MNLLRSCSSLSVNEKRNKVLFIGKCLKRLAKLIQHEAPDFGDQELAAEWISELLSLPEVTITETCRTCKLTLSEFPSLAKFLQIAGVYCHPEAAVQAVVRNIIEWLHERKELSDIAKKVVDSVGGRTYFRKLDLDNVYETNDSVTKVVRGFSLGTLTPQEVEPIEKKPLPQLYSIEDAIRSTENE